MFSRSQSEPDGALPAGAPQGPAEPAVTGGDAARAFDQVLSELQPPGTPSTETGVAGVSASATEHAATLRATRDAHQEAQAMLAMANEARRQASEEAERIVLEARDAADRSRQEVSGWAAAQRAKVDALAADLVASANKDADAIRAEALRTSMAEAEETARLHIAAAADQAQRDSDEIRGQARNVLQRAIELSEESAEAIGDLSSTVSDILSRLQDVRGSMTQLLADNPRSDAFDEPAPLGDEPAPLGDEPALLGDEDALPGDEDALAGDEDALAGDEDAPLGDDVADDEVGDIAPSEEELLVMRGESLADDEPLDRQLGSMFRRHGRRGD